MKPTTNIKSLFVTAYIVQNHFSKFSSICCRFLQKWESENNLKNVSNEKLFQVASENNLKTISNEKLFWVTSFSITDFF